MTQRSAHFPVPRILSRFWAWLRRPTSAMGVVGRILLVLFLFFTLDIGRYFFWPFVGNLAGVNPERTSFMEYRERQWRRAGEERQIAHTWRDMKRMSRYLPLAVTIAEDDTFWEHGGFDLKGMREAMEANLRLGRLSAGGSTITQQLVKNLYFTPDKSILRKIKEAIVTWRMERALGKERILELYLNVVEWGPGIFGAEAASRAWFKKGAGSLTAREAAVLASMLPNPLVRKPGSSVVQRKATIIVRAMQRRGVR